MKLTIDRTIWARGGRRYLNQLLFTEFGGRKQCCLGIFASACGIPDHELKGLAEPCEIENRFSIYDYPESFRFLLFQSGEILQNSAVAFDFMKTNDNQDVTERGREEMIAELFASQGIAVEFVN